MSAEAAISIRPARTDERSALEALQRRSSLAVDAFRDALLAHPDAIDLPQAHVGPGSAIVAEQGGETIGFAIVLPREDGQAELDGLFVEPECWNRGAGRALVEAAGRLAQAWGADWLYVVASSEAVAFYDKARFQQCGMAQTRFAPAAVMRRSVV